MRPTTRRVGRRVVDGRAHELMVEPHRLVEGDQCGGLERGDVVVGCSELRRRLSNDGGRPGGVGGGDQRRRLSGSTEAEESPAVDLLNESARRERLERHGAHRESFEVFARGELGDRERVTAELFDDPHREMGIERRLPRRVEEFPS